MDPKWIQVLVMLLFSQKINSASAHVAKAKEGKDVSIQCTPKKDGASMVIWFRVLDKSGMEFIASVALSGQLKKSAHYFDQIFRLTESHTLTLKSFKREDSGIYSCACLVGGNRLEFGAVTKLELEEETKKATEAPAPQLTAQMTTTNKCDCKDKDQTDSSMFCAPIILGPLAGGCGLLLLLLFITTIYCNKMRTRRCPHHHRRKPRMDALEKQMMVNRHV